MPDAVPTITDPRWGQADRDTKAEAILRTIELMTPERDVRRGTWLDIGCGSGGIAATLAQRVDSVIGVDPESWQRWEQFRTVHSNLKLHQGSYRDLDTLCGSNSIDVAVCNQVYEHVDDPVALLAAIHRVLKPGGLCYFAGPNLLWPIEPHVFWPFVHWLPRKFAQRCMHLMGSKLAHDLDAWSWTYWKLVRHFRLAGFIQADAIHERLRAVSTKNGKTSSSLRWLPKALVNSLAPFAPGFVFVLRKDS
jgi:2-polyprenyl-3-methyl-5-hydroxy-6-metoxy-1,4-benzoquinol methylase